MQLTSHSRPYHIARRTNHVRHTARPRLEILEDRTLPSTFTVINANDTGTGSLRAAILAANSHAGADVINFKIGTGAQTIALANPLPAIIGTVSIAGNTQPGFTGNPLIELNGAGAGAGANGLVLRTTGSVVRGLVINRFAGSGVVFVGPGTLINTLVSNRIGTNAAGTSALGNGGDGVLIAAGARFITITNNIISGNQGHGIALSGTGVQSNMILSNKIGLGADGTTVIANAFSGVRVGEGASGNTIGGSTSAARNFIGGNGLDGVVLDGPGTNGNLIANNFIGENAAAAAARNGTVNVWIRGGAVGNVVAGNSIGGASNSAVQIEGAGTASNVVKGNLIGLNASSATLGGGFAGIFLEKGANHNLIGGTTPAARNVIAGFSVNIEISDAGTTGNKVQSNFIGTNIAGTAGITGSNGIQIVTGASGNIIGGIGAGNLISGNNAALTITDANTNANVIQANRFGTNAAGTATVANLVGINVLNGASNNQIGGTAPGAGNTIVGSNNGGVFVTGNGTTGNVLQGNFIGVTASGLALGNTGAGIDIENNAANNLIGGITAGAGNTIANSTTQGVLIGGRFNATIPAGTGNSVLGNRIFNNGGLGIDLGPADGVTANDTDDNDTGPNNLQNFPVITSAALFGGFLFVQGTLDAPTTGNDFRIEFFINSAADSSGHGEGQTFLGAFTVFGSGSTDLAFTAVLPATAVHSGQVLSATATDLTTRNTSEFSANVTVV